MNGDFVNAVVDLLVKIEAALIAIPEEFTKQENRIKELEDRVERLADKLRKD